MQLPKFWILFSILASTTLCYAQENCTSTLDIVFVVDGSNSVTRRNYVLVKESLRNAVAKFSVLPGQTRVGVVSYGGRVMDEIQLTDDLTMLQNAIDALVQPDGGTATHEGIASATAMLTGLSRRALGVQQVIVVLTDGDSDKQNLTYSNAQDAKNRGIVMLAVGIGAVTAVSDEELLGIASSREFVYRLPSFQQLEEKLSNLTLVVCPTICGGVDAVFVQDGSNSISRRDFSTALSAIQDTAITIWGNFSQSRIGFVTYGTLVGDTIPITNNDNDFIRRINNIVRPDTGTGTDLALTAARSQLQGPVRADVPRIIILVTDGQSNSPSKTLQVADDIKKDGIDIYTIGVGRYIDRNELQGVSSRVDMAFNTVQDFSLLRAQLTALVESVCVSEITTAIPVTTPPPITQCTQPVALLFVIDGSSEVGAANFERLKTAVTSAALIFDYGPTGAEVGAVSYSNTVKGGFGPVESFTAFVNGIQTLAFPGGPRTTSEGMRQAAQYLINANRSDAVNVMVVVTTGTSDNSVRVSTDSFFVRQMGIQTFVLGVTNAVSQTEMRAIANQQPDQMATAATYDDVNSSLNTLMSNVCLTAARRG